MTDLQETLVLVKPDGVARGLTGEILRRVEAKGYELVDLRIERTEALEERRARMDAPLDRMTTAFWQKAMGDRAWRRLDPSLWD